MRGPTCVCKDATPTPTTTTTTTTTTTSTPVLAGDAQDSKDSGLASSHKRAIVIASGGLVILLAACIYYGYTRKVKGKKDAAIAKSLEKTAKSLEKTLGGWKNDDITIKVVDMKSPKSPAEFVETNDVNTATREGEKERKASLMKLKAAQAIRLHLAKTQVDSEDEGETGASDIESAAPRTNWITEK
jgi:hypothetical protein